MNTSSQNITGCLHIALAAPGGAGRYTQNTANRHPQCKQAGNDQNSA